MLFYSWYSKKLVNNASRCTHNRNIKEQIVWVKMVFAKRRPTVKR